MTGSLLRVLVVDDEEPARQRLVDLLRRDTGVGAIMEASDGLGAVEICVAEADVPRARSLLDSAEAGTFRLGDDA